MLPSLSRVIPHGWLNWPSPLPAEPHFPTNFPSGVKTSQTVVAAVDNNDVAVFLDRRTSGAHQLPVAAACCAPFPQEVAAAVERGDGLSPVIGDVDVVVVVDGNPVGPGHFPSPSPYSQKSAICSSSPRPPLFTLLTCIPKLFSLPRLVA